MFVTVVTVNWGRGYEPGEFKANVDNVLDHVEGRDHVVLCVQELDEEPDLAPEHKVFNDMLDDPSIKVGWGTSEPIVLLGFDKAVRERVRVTMESGGKLRPPGPKGTGPTRHAVTCIGLKDGLEIGFGNTHPHRAGLGPAVEKAKRQGLGVFRSELIGVQRKRVPLVWCGDMNDHSLGVVVPGERSAIHRGNDYIRYRNHPRARTRIDLVGAQGLRGATIDPHDPLVARFRVTTRNR